MKKCKEYCGRGALPGKTRCKQCSEKEVNRTTKMQRRRISMGLCPDCGKNKPGLGIYRCKECSDKGKVRMVKLHAKWKTMGLCSTCGKYPVDVGKLTCLSCREKSNQKLINQKDVRLPKRREKRQILKRQIMDMLGGKCACCGETELAFLTIDHINSDGKKHRAEIKSVNIYPDIIKYPDRYALQVLCFNCNMAKSMVGECPHKIIAISRHQEVKALLV